MIKLTGRTRIESHGLKRFEKRLKVLVEKQVETGFFDDKHYSGLTMAQLMTIHEFGYNNLPQRNVMLSSALSFKYQVDKFAQRVYKDVVFGGKSPEVSYKIIANKFEEAIRFTIDAGTFKNPTVSPAWAKVKGFNDAMHHYGDLRDSVKSKVTDSPYTYTVRGI